MAKLKSSRNDYQDMTMGFEPSPLNREIHSYSQYEDVQTITRIGSAEMTLVGKFENWYNEILENFYRLAGHILSAADLAKLVSERRPTFEWNLFQPILLGILGNFKNSIPALTFTAAGNTIEEMQGAIIQKKLSDYFLYNANDIQYEISKALLFALAARIGWLKTDWSYAKDRDGMVSFTWYNSLRLKFDTNWTRRDTSDMRYMSDCSWLDPSEMIDIYAKNNAELHDEIYERAVNIVGESQMRKGRLQKMMLTWAERFLNDDLAYQGAKHGFDSFIDSQVAYNFGGTWYSGDGRFKCVDWYERRPQMVMEIIDLASGQREEITEDVKDPRFDPFSEKRWWDTEKLASIKARYRSPQIIQSEKELIWQVSVCPALNLKMYDKAMTVQSGFFKFVPVLCADLHPDILETKSMIDILIDPVTSYNLRRNTLLTYVLKMSSGGWIGEASAIAGREDEFQANEIGGLKTVNDGALSGKKLIRDTPPSLPSGLLEESELEANDVQTLSAQGQNMRGQKETNQESGTLYNQRVEQGNLVLEWYNDNAQSAILYASIHAHNVAQVYLTQPRLIAIIGDEEDPEYLQINQRIGGRVLNDISFGRYSINLSKQPAGKKSQEAEAAKVHAEADWLIKNFGPQYVDPKSVLKMSTISIKNEMISHIRNIEKAAEEQQKQQAEEQQKQQQDQMQQRRLAMTANKIKMLGALNGLHSGTLHNRQLAQNISDSQMQNSMFNQQQNGAAA